MSRKQRPPQSMQVICSGGANTGAVWHRRADAAPRAPVGRILRTMRVVAGSLGGRKLVAPEGFATRPTTDRVREAVFNSLGSLGVVEGAIVADLFAGSGAVGIEALSRGAEHCTFVETDRAALRALESNLASLGLESRSRVLRGDALVVAAGLDVDLVLADPPYDFDGWGELLGQVTAGMLVAEGPAPVEAVEGWVQIRTRRYGRTWVSYLESDPQ